MAGRIGLREGLGDPAYPYAAVVSATSPPPEPGCGASDVSSRFKRQHTWSTAERPPDRGGAVWRATRAGASPVVRSGRPTFGPPGVPYYPALGVGQSFRWGYVTPTCAHALASTHPSAAGALRAAHEKAMVAFLVYTHAWVTRGAGAVLRESPSPTTALAEQFLVDNTPDANGYQMASSLQGHGRRVAPGPAVPSAVLGCSQAPYAEEPAGSAAPYHGGGYPTSTGGYAAAEAAQSRAPRSTWGPGPADQRSALEYSVDPPGYDHYGGYARDDHPHSPGRE